MIAAALSLALVTASAAATPATCAHAGALRSIDPAPGTDARPVQHYFQNGTGQPLRLHWLDQTGKRVALDAVEPGRFVPMTTYRGHVFVLTDPGGRCRAAIRIGDGSEGSYIGTSRYVRQPIPGWWVFADRALDPAVDPGRTALATIARMLRETEGVLPPAALGEVRATPIYLLDHAGPGGMYHFGPDWPVAHGRTVELSSGIEISDAAMFLETARNQPWAVFHELAHSHYAKLTDADRAEVERVYQAVIAKGLYRRVKRADGWEGPAYASGSAVEYFAEASEAYFGRNDFFPFTRAELATYDPEGFALMQRMWR